jgi:predicted RNase H-like nuclease (RuvC/YqgF family)
VETGILTAGLTAITSLVAGLLAWSAGRKKQAAEAEKTVSEGFNMLVTKLQEERQSLIKVIDEQSEEIVQLRSEVRSLSRQVMKLESALEKAGVEVPNAGNAS